MEREGLLYLVEGVYCEVVTSVFVNDLDGLIVRVEAVHEDQRHIYSVACVEIFDLLDRRIQE